MSSIIKRYTHFVIARNDEAILVWLLASILLRKLIMTKLVTPSLRGTKQSRSSRLYLDCFVYFDTSTGSVHRFAQQPPRNDGDLNRHQSFLQGIYPMPGARNDVIALLT